MKRVGCTTVMALLVLLLLPTMVQAKTINTDKGAVYIGSAKLPKVKYGTAAEIKIPLINGEDHSISDVRVTLISNKDPQIYPFTTMTTNNFVAVPEEIKPGKKTQVAFTVDVNEQALTQNYDLEVAISYVMRYEVEQENVIERVNFTKPIVISISGNPDHEESLAEGEDEPTQPEGDSGNGNEGTEAPNYEGGNYDENEPIAAPPADEGATEPGKVATPHVIVEGFTTSPKVVNAGDNFTLKLQLKNTSKKTAITNMTLTLQSAYAEREGEGDTASAAGSEAFLPVSGASTVYIDRIEKNSVKEISVELIARADLTQKPYAVEMAMNYEDDQAEPYEGAASISIPIKQAARFELGQVEIAPDMAAVGEEIDVSFEIYNMGRTKLYNVWVRLETPTLAGAETFVGNISAGETATVDLMAIAEQETTDDGTVKIAITYEDQDGNQGDYESSCVIFVTPEQDMNMDEMGDWPDGESEDNSSAGKNLWWILIVGLIVVAGIVVAVVVKKKKHKKTEDFTDEFFGSDQDEQ